MPQKLPHWLVSLTVILLSAPATLADVSLPNIFSDHMVLQQKQANKIWGKADPGESVSLSIDGQVVKTVADEAGMWIAKLPVLDAGGPYTLSVQGKNAIKLEDVLVGEVWICSGQSNMEWSINRVNDPDLIQVTANFPEIRMINYPNVGSQTPVWSHSDANWMVCSPETVSNFSGVGYFFGLTVYQAIDVPIGLVNNSWGGSAVDGWIDQSLLKADAAYQPTWEAWQAREKRLAELTAKTSPTAEEKKEVTALRRALGSNQRPGNLYNGILKSHLGYGIRGAIWYQGESNASRAYQYRHLFPKMIQSWRDDWGQGDFPFYWVQLADFRAEKDEPGDSDWAELREAQSMTMTKLPNTGEAVIIDLGEAKDIHPRNKLRVGQRLARWALANEYGFDIACHSPSFKSMEKKDGKIILTFDHVHGGWRPFDVAQPLGFAIAGSDKQFVKATAKVLDQNSIEVSSDQVADPQAVRYAWADNPECNMYDMVGLPLTPFRTDDWPGVTMNRFVR